MVWGFVSVPGSKVANYLLACAFLTVLRHTFPMKRTVRGRCYLCSGRVFQTALCLWMNTPAGENNSCDGELATESGDHSF